MASLEFQFPIWGAAARSWPEGRGVLPTPVRSSVIKGLTNFANLNNGEVVRKQRLPDSLRQGNTITVGGDSSTKIRSSVGVIDHLGLAALGPIRFDFAKALTKDTNDQTQILPLLRVERRF